MKNSNNIDLKKRVHGWWEWTREYYESTSERNENISGIAVI